MTAGFVVRQYRLHRGLQKNKLLIDPHDILNLICPTYLNPAIDTTLIRTVLHYVFVRDGVGESLSGGVVGQLNHGVGHLGGIGERDQGHPGTSLEIVPNELPRRLAGPFP